MVQNQNDADFNYIRNFYPQASQVYERPKAETPLRIFLILADSATPYHLSAYGYNRNTCPSLCNDNSWIKYKYAHAQWTYTRKSLPSIFTSNYLPPFNANSIFSALRTKINNITFSTSSFLKSDNESIINGNLDQTIILSPSDKKLTDLPKEWLSPKYKNDASIDDKETIDTLLHRLTTDRSDNRSFHVLHLMSSHYPYRAGPFYNVFSPSLDHNTIDTQAISAGGKKLINSYDNSLLYIDFLVGHFIKSLSALNMLENSVIILTSDHGESFGEHGLNFHYGGFYNQQLHVPLFIRVGAEMPKLKEYLLKKQDALIGLVDISPTILDIFDIIIPSSFEGISLLSPYEKTHELSFHSGSKKWFALYNISYKYIYDYYYAIPMEYNLVRDPFEKHDLCSTTETSKISIKEFLQLITNKNNYKLKSN